MQVDAPPGHTGARTDLFDLRVNQDINVLLGCGLGGTSLINANVSLEPEPRVFDDPRWPAESAPTTTAASRTAIARAAEMLKPQPYPAAPRLPKLDALAKAAAAFDGGDDFYRPPINVTFEDGATRRRGAARPATSAATASRAATTGAKNTTLMNYLPDARNNGAEIFTRVAVQVRRARDGDALARPLPARSTAAASAFDARAASSRPTSSCSPPARSARPRSCCAREQQRPGASPTGSAALQRQRRRARLRLQRRRGRSTASASARRDRGPRPVGPVHRRPHRPARARPTLEPAW